MLVVALFLFASSCAKFILIKSEFFVPQIKKNPKLSQDQVAPFGSDSGADLPQFFLFPKAQFTKFINYNAKKKTYLQMLKNPKFSSRESK